MYTIKTENCEISIGNEFIESYVVNLTSKYSKIYILIDSNVLEFYQKIIKSLKNCYTYNLKSNEQNKSILQAELIWKHMLECEIDRNSLMLNIGGGIAGDLGGFVASTYMRGIDFINIPTTLLAMIDASVGGKNAVNLNHYKNMIGTFNLPKKVLIDAKLLETLPKKQVINGLYEAVKHGLIADRNYAKDIVDNIENYTKLQGIEEVIIKSINIKNNIVNLDFTEKSGLRSVLNFGHTIGHGIEAILNEKETKILHGEAVVIGMLIESELFFTNNLISNNLHKFNFNILSELMKIVDKNIFNEISNHQVIDNIILAMKKDKKNKNGKISFSIPDGNNKVIEASFEDKEIYKIIHSLVGNLSI